MVTVLDGADAYLNTYWCTPETGDIEPIELGALLGRSKAAAQLALNMAATASTLTSLHPADFVVVVHHSREEGAGLCLAPASHLDEDEEKAVEQALRAFFEEFAAYADTARGLVHIDRDYCQVTFRDARALLNVMRAFHDDHDALYTADDLEAGPATPEQAARAIAAGQECLRDAWLYAMLPERDVSSRAALYELAHRAGMTTVPCPYDAIEAAVDEAERRESEAAPAQRRAPGFNPYGMRLH